MSDYRKTPRLAADPAPRIRNLFFAVASAVVLVIVHQLLRSQEGERSFVAFGGAWGALFLTMWAIDLCLRIILPRACFFLAAILASYFPAFFCLFDAFHFQFFRAHVDKFVLATGYMAVTTGEISFDTWIYLWYILWSTLWCLVSTVCLVGFRRWMPTVRLFERGIFVVALLLILCSILRPAAGAEDILPPFLTFKWRPVAAAQTNGSQSDTFDVYTERKQFHTLEERSEDILSSLGTPTRTPNILIVHLESVRRDMFQPQTMPRLFAFAENCLREKRCLVPEHHYSTGNNTGTGVFGLLHGLSGYYFHVAKREFAPPFPVSALRRLGYKRSFYASMNWDYDDLYTLFFKNSMEVSYEDRSSKDQWARDENMVSRYLKDTLESPESEPRFDYMVWYGTHYIYFYPPAFEKFTPVVPPDSTIYSGSLGQLKPVAELLKNRYRNSMLFADATLSNLLEQLRVAGKTKNTIVVLVGDHGEEFWEKGRFGHTYGLSTEQIETFFLAIFPDTVQSNYHYTSHADVMPTIFDFIGLDTRRFTTGKSLLRYDPSLDYALVSMGIVLDQVSLDHMIIGNGLKVRFKNRDNAAPIEVTDLSDNKLELRDDDSIQKLLQQALAAKRLEP